MIGDMAGGAGLLAEMVNKNIQRQNYVDACDSAEAWRDAAMSWKSTAKEWEQKALIEESRVFAVAAQRDALKRELQKVAPSHEFFRSIGLDSKNKAVTSLTLILYDIFDKKIKEKFGSVDPRKFRPYRVK
jgi:hypothetical protein